MWKNFQVFLAMIINLNILNLFKLLFVQQIIKMQYKVNYLKKN